jgi:hypothetical protein
MTDMIFRSEIDKAPQERRPDRSGGTFLSWSPAEEGLSTSLKATCFMWLIFYE